MKLLTCLIAAIIALASCGTKKAANEGIAIEGNSSYEATIFRQNCAICHGPEAYGKTIDGKIIPSLRSGDAATRSEAELFAQIKHGKLPMPPFKDQLTETEMHNMTKFIMRDLQGRK